jgi:predicted dehydrogenase
VICEKPFIGYFGRPGDATPIGRHVAKSAMYERVIEKMNATGDAIRASGRLFMKAEESHSGSHAAHAAQWSMTGGGALIRQGCHPLSAVLYLKQVEAVARGETITVANVTCDVGTLTADLKPDERRFFQASPVDVEDWGMLTLTFSDGTKATIFAGDMIVGGVRNLVETFTTGGALFANIGPNNHMVSYLTDEAKLGGVDLAYDAIRIHYAAYWAAEEGRRITL